MVGGGGSGGGDGGGGGSGKDVETVFFDDFIFLVFSCVCLVSDVFVLLVAIGNTSTSCFIVSVETFFILL